MSRQDRPNCFESLVVKSRHPFQPREITAPDGGTARRYAAAAARKKPWPQFVGCLLDSPERRKPVLGGGKLPRNSFPGRCGNPPVWRPCDRPDSPAVSGQHLRWPSAKEVDNPEREALPNKKRQWRAAAGSLQRSDCQPSHGTAEHPPCTLQPPDGGWAPL